MSPTSVGRGHYKMMACICLSVCPSVCRMPRPNSRTERPRKPKIGRMEDRYTSNLWTYLEVKRSKVTRPINAVTDNAPNAGQGHYNFLKTSLLHSFQQDQTIHGGGLSTTQKHSIMLITQLLLRNLTLWDVVVRWLCSFLYDRLQQGSNENELNSLKLYLNG